MFGFGGGGHRILEALWGIGSFFVGAFFFLLWVGILILLVRFLILGTRAAKHYLASNGQHTGLLGAAAQATAAAPTEPTPPTASAASASPVTPTSPTEPVPPTVTKPTPRPRTPKTPPTI